MNFTTIKFIVCFIVIIVGGLLTAVIDGTLGLNEAFDDVGPFKAIIHKVVYMTQGIAIWLAVTWTDD